MRREEEGERFLKDISVLQINDKQVKEQLSSYNNIDFWHYLKEGTGEKSNTAIIIGVAALAGLCLQSGMGAWSSKNYMVSLIPTATSTNTPTFTRTNTFTHTSTYTPSITFTPSLTFTSTATLTPTITFTPSFTSTFTMTITPSRTFPSISGISCLPDNERVSAIVTRVIDGDTIEVNISGKIYSLRYIGIDTPENTTTSEYYGSQATKLNQKLVEGKTVILVKDVSEIDRYDRLLRYVIVGNKFVNYELVKIGAAIAANYDPDSSCSSMFYSAMVEAQNNEVGMWRPTPAPAPTSSNSGGSGGGGCNCSIDYDCKDFATHSQAQGCFNSCGGSPSYNWSRLDADHDGSACEALP